MAAREAADVQSVIGDLTLACRLYRWEFLLPELDPQAPEKFERRVEELSRKGIDALVSSGILLRNGDTLEVLDRDSALLVRDVLQNYHEVYLSALLTLRQRVLGDMTGDSSRLARAHYDQALAENRFVKPEGKTRINLQGAFQACKDLRLNRPPSGEYPYEKGELGDQLIQFLEASTCSLE